MFVLQAAVVKGRGGIETAARHYARMFRDVGVRSALVYRGPSLGALRSDDIDVIEATPLLTSPIAGVAPVLGSLRDAVMRRAGEEDIALIVHSDLALPALRRLFPSALAITPCHSDNFKHKRKAHLVITLNASQDALARQALPNVAVAQLGNPYVEPAAAPLTEAGPIRFNFVARFIPTKDPTTLIRAAAMLSELRPQVRFIGDGELETELRSLAQSESVDAAFPGWLAAPFQSFHRNDVLVLPSRWEGLPYLLQEALHHGVAIIAADNPGNRAALKDDAYGALFQFGDADALAKAMREAASDLGGLRSKAEKGRAALVENYGATAFWRRLEREMRRRVE